MTQRRRWPDGAESDRVAAIEHNGYADEQLAELTRHLQRTINDPLALLLIERARRSLWQSTAYLRHARAPDGE